MSSVRLKSYSSNFKKIAEANARDGQMQLIRKSRFKASLVDNPLESNPEMVRAVKESRKVPRK